MTRRGRGENHKDEKITLYAFLEWTGAGFGVVP